jgi:hypothetical protein
MKTNNFSPKPSKRKTGVHTKKKSSNSKKSKYYTKKYKGQGR